MLSAEIKKKVTKHEVRKKIWHRKTSYALPWPNRRDGAMVYLRIYSTMKFKNERYIFVVSVQIANVCLLDKQRM